MKPFLHVISSLFILSKKMIPNRRYYDFMNVTVHLLASVKGDPVLKRISMMEMDQLAKKSFAL